MRTPRMSAAVGDSATTESPRRAQRTILRAEPPPPPQARARTRLKLALGSSLHSSTRLELVARAHTAQIARTRARRGRMRRCARLEWHSLLVSHTAAAWLPACDVQERACPGRRGHHDVEDADDARHRSSQAKRSELACPARKASPLHMLLLLPWCLRGGSKVTTHDSARSRDKDVARGSHAKENLLARDLVPDRTPAVAGRGHS